MSNTLTATANQLTRTLDLDNPFDWTPSMELTITADPPTTGIAAAYSSEGDWLGGPALFDSGVAGVVTSAVPSGPFDPRALTTQLTGSVTLSADGYTPLTVPVLLLLD